MESDINPLSAKKSKVKVTLCERAPRLPAESINIIIRKKQLSGLKQESVIINNLVQEPIMC